MSDKKEKKELLSVAEVKDRIESEGLAYALDGYYGRALNSEDEKLNQLWEKAYDAMSALDTYLFIKDD